MRLGERWKAYPKVRVATVAVVITAVGVVPGADSSAGERAADARLAYTCRFPSGVREISARVTGTFPAGATVGRSIQPGKVTVTLTVPRAALDDVTKLDAAVVSGVAELTTAVTQNGTSADAGWQGMPVPVTPVPSEGDLVLTVPGTVPPVTADAAGDVTFTAGDLALTLRPRKVDGTATSPATMSPSCTLGPGQDATLASVPVSGSEVSPSPTAPGDHRRGSLTVAAAEDTPPEDWCPPMPTGGLNPKFPLPPVPPGSIVIPMPPEAMQAGCAYTKGRSNVKKLNSAAPLGPDLANFAVGARIVLNPDPEVNYFEVDSFGEIEYRPTQGTFLTFGFMPTTAKMQLTQIGMMNNVAVGDAGMEPRKPLVSTIYTDVSLRIYDVKVNGTPLDVGPRCLASKPIELILVGRDDLDPSNDDVDPPYTIAGGGPLFGTMEIPPFSGCGADEDLDPLFTASISGPGNHVRVVQGPLCFPQQWQDPNASGCGPDGPKPVPEN